MKLALLILMTLVVAWFWGDFLYSRMVAMKLRKWEATIQRDQGGVRVGCRAFSRGAGDDALLLVHGINDSPRLFEGMADQLADRGFYVRAMRMPGFAERVEQYARYGRHHWIKAVQAEVEMLRGAGKRVSIVAHSLGGAVAIAYALKHPDTIERLILLAPAVEVSNRRSVLLPVRAWHEIGRRSLAFTTITKSPYSVDARNEEAKKYPWMTPFVPLKVVDETFALLDENRGKAATLKVPMMMVLSKHDLVVDWEAAKAFYEQANPSEGHLLYAEDAGHTLPIDNGWRTVTDEIVKFCRSGEERR